MNVLITVLSAVLEQTLKALDPQTAKEFVDDVLDKLENMIANSQTQVDDRLLLPLIQKLREVADIPDDIGGDED